MKKPKSKPSPNSDTIFIEILRKGPLSYSVNERLGTVSFSKPHILKSAIKTDGKYLLVNNYPLGYIGLEKNQKTIGISDSPMDAEKRIYDSAKEFAEKLYLSKKDRFNTKIVDKTPQASQLELKFE